MRYSAISGFEDWFCILESVAANDLIKWNPGKIYCVFNNLVYKVQNIRKYRIKFCMLKINRLEVVNFKQKEFFVFFNFVISAFNYD